MYMANAGRHNDTRLLKRMIKEEKLIKISPKDHPFVKIAKLKFNEIVIGDIMANSNFGGKKFVTHSAWNRIGPTLILINQLRFRYWYFESIKGQLIKSS